MMPGMFAPQRKPLPDTLTNAAEQGQAIGKGIRMAGEALRTAFGGGAITGESADRRQPTEQMMIGNPMAHPMAADSVKMPQDLQSGYMHMNRFGSPLPIHGLGTPGRTSMAISADPDCCKRVLEGNCNSPGRTLVSLETVDPGRGFALVNSGAPLPC